MPDANPSDWPEPLALLHGDEAKAAIAAGQASPLAGGPIAFTLLRRGPNLLSHTAAPAPLITAPPQWANLRHPAIMGILNATPDSFSDGGLHLDPGSAIEAGRRMLAEGADLLDIGGESTRPGATPIPPEIEQARILPVIAALAQAGAIISVDTRNAVTMARALDAGARIVNDVSALTHDPASLPLVAARRCPVILMHMRGTPATMTQHAIYTDVATEVATELAARIQAARNAGIAAADIMIDPGFGFAKTPEHDVTLLRRLAVLANLGHPILAGISRKRSIGAITGETRFKRRAPGSIAAALAALDRGARILRVHDVAETRQAMRVWQALDETPWSGSHVDACKAGTNPAPP